MAKKKSSNIFIFITNDTLHKTVYSVQPVLMHAELVSDVLFLLTLSVPDVLLLKMLLILSMVEWQWQWQYCQQMRCSKNLCTLLCSMDFHKNPHTKRHCQRFCSTKPSVFQGIRCQFDGFFLSNDKNKFAFLLK